MLLSTLVILVVAIMVLITWLQEKGEKKIPQKLKLALTWTVFLNPQIKKIVQCSGKFKRKERIFQKIGWVSTSSFQA